MAIGLSLIFGTTGLVNFAHAEMVTFGALIAWFFNQTPNIQIIPAAILAMLVGGVAGGAFDLGVWRPLRRRKTGLIAMMVASRSEERRGGKECVGTCRSRWSPYH